MKYFTWRNNPQWLATAHAESVAQARELLLGEVGGIDGSCIVRAKARQVISEEAPAIWVGPNAEFALTDSAELEELDAEATRIRAELEAEKDRRGLADLAAGACREQLYAAQGELAAANGRIAGLAAVLERANETLKAVGCDYAIDPATPKTILAADRKAQRAKGAAWALREAARQHKESSDLNALDAMEFLAHAIERGEVEVPE